MAFLNFNYNLVLFSIFVLFVMNGSVAIKFPTGTKSEPSKTVTFDGFPKGSTLTSLLEPPPIKNHDKNIVDTDLAAFVRLLPDQSGVFSHAIELLNSMQASPSCNRLATLTLLNSCQTIEASSHDHEGSLDDMKSIYAAQLAICEISSTGLTIPPECELLKPKTDKDELRGFVKHSREGRMNTSSWKKIGKHQLSQCLRSLESRPQWWTSYSNSRQNAVVMCQAARVDIDKDDLIKLHKSMTQTSADVDLALLKALENASKHLSRQRDFAVAVGTLQNNLMRDLKSSSDDAKSFMAKLINTMDIAIQAILSKMTSATDDVESDMARLQNNIQKSNTEIVDLGETVERVFEKILRSTSGFAANQAQQQDMNRGLATEVQASLQHLREFEVQEVLAAFSKIHNQLHTSDELISVVFHRQNMIDERLANLDRSFASIETIAEAIHASQVAQIETQTRLSNNIDQMQTNLYLARGLLADVISSASGLLATVEETSMKIAQMATFGGLASTFFQWGWLILVVFILYQFNPRHAGNVAATLVFLLLISASGVVTNLQQKFYEIIPADTVLIHHASGYQITLLPLLKVAALLTFVSAVAILHRLSIRSQAGADPTSRSELKLPFLKMISLRRNRDS